MESVKYIVLLFVLRGATSYILAPADREYSVYLAHTCVTSSSVSADKPPVIMLHGLTDYKETWDGLYQPIPLLTGRRVCVYDARNHGDSGWSNDTFDIDVLAEDLGDFMRFMEIEKAALVGHSMGGLTVMRFALKNPGKVERIFVEDISPRPPKEVGVQIRVTLLLLVQSLSAIPGDADEEIAKKTVAEYVSNVTKETLPPEFYKRLPLHCKDGVWQWKMNIEAFIKASEDPESFYGEMEGVYDGKSLFIYGEASPLKVLDDKEKILKHFPNTAFVGVEGADHQVHAHTKIFLSTLVKFLNS